MSGSLEIYRLKGIKVLRLALSLLLISTIAFAQSQPRTQIRIIIQDDSGNAIPSATAQIKLNGNIVSTVTTDAKGEAASENLAPGTYEVSVTQEGFEPSAQGGIAVVTGQTVEVKFVLVQKIQLKEEVNVSASANAAPEQTSSPPASLGRETIRNVLGNDAETVTDALPLIPGVVRSPQGEIKISGTGENRSAFIVNSADVTDPATGQFGMTVPVDIVESVSVFKTPYLAQYGRFTAGVVSVETKRGGDKWNFELNDPLPEFRILNGHLRGLRTATPRVVFNGPLIKNKLYLSQGSEYTIKKHPVQTLEYPNKETKTESINSFTQLDYIFKDTHTLTGTFHFAPRKDEWVNLDFFNRRPVTPNWRGRDYTGTLIDRLSLGQNLVESTVAVKRYTVDVWAQGTDDMVLTPTGNQGNYFSQQARDATRVEWLETFSVKPLHGVGVHNLKLGSVIARTTNDGEFIARPVDIQDINGNLLRRIQFVGGQPFDLDDFETYFFGQDHWNVTPKLSLDVGLRFERQGITNTYRIAPRTGIAFAPFANQKTVFRAGFGYFYDRVPLSVYAFPTYPEQLITTFGPGGAIIDGPRLFANITDTEERSNNPLIGGGARIGNFAPSSETWNFEVEHTFSQHLRLRTNYLNSKSTGIVIVDPRVVNGQDALVLGGAGQSRYRQFEVTGRVTWNENKQQIFASYVRSNSKGDVNEFNTYIGNFPFPLVRPNQFARLSADLPNRYLTWGTFELPWKLRYSPILEYRNGFPFSSYDQLQNYVGDVNSKRFPNFYSFDSRISRDFQVNPKYALRFTLKGFNLTNHFNPVDVYRNVTDPRF
ncbi:MAG: TonB-dependent receptor, partial [Blastocatellia bacterium]|nr:TonB-dependent receptor [Blastocatellia bacterium]